MPYGQVTGRVGGSWYHAEYAANETQVQARRRRPMGPNEIGALPIELHPTRGSQDSNLGHRFLRAVSVSIRGGSSPSALTTPCIVPAELDDISQRSVLLTKCSRNSCRSVSIDHHAAPVGRRKTARTRGSRPPLTVRDHHPALTTDQKVGDSSSSERTAETPASAGVSSFTGGERTVPTSLLESCPNDVRGEAGPTGLTPRCHARACGTVRSRWSSN